MTRIANPEINYNNYDTFGKNLYKLSVNSV